MTFTLCDATFCSSTLVSIIFIIISFLQYYEYALSMDGKGRGRGGDGTKEGTDRK